MLKEASLEIRADDVELQDLLQDERKRGLLLSPATPTANDAGDAAEDEELLLKKPSSNDEPPKLPWLQLLFYLVMRASSPLFFLVVFPYIAFFLVELGVADEAHVGHYSGWVESIVAIGSLLTVHIWSHLSDKYGRKPILLISVGANCVLSGVFGFSRSYKMLLVIRFLMGLAKSGQAATTKVMLAESADGTQLARGFALLGLGWQSGALMAPALGGMLAKPAESMPSLFKGGVFDAYPYALPSLAVAVPPAVIVLLSIPLMRETHPKYRKTKQYSIESVKAVPHVPAEQLPSLWSCNVHFTILILSLMLVYVLAFQAIEILFFFSSPSLGGLGLKRSQMSMYLTLRPFLVCLYEINVFPKLSKRYGPERILRVLMCFVPLISMLYLLLSTTILNGHASASGIVMTLGLSLVLQVFSNPAFLCLDMMVPSRSPTQQQLSRTNAVNEVSAQLAVAIGAGAGSSLFAVSVSIDDGFFRGKLVWLALIGLTATTATIAQWVTHIPGWREREAQRDTKG